MNMVVCAGSPSTFAASRGRVLVGLAVMLMMGLSLVWDAVEPRGGRACRSERS